MLYSRIIAAVLLLALPGQQSCSPALYIPGESEVTSTASLAELRQGRQIYVAKCGSCHTLYLPEKYRKEQWRELLDKMSHKVTLDSNDKALILKYVNKGI